MQIKFLQAFNGDAIYISYHQKDGTKKNILIDGGTSSTYSPSKKKKGKKGAGSLKFLIDSLKKDEKINLLIITHWDDDHLGGILNWFESDKNAINKVENIWFNAGILINEYFDKQFFVENENVLKIYDSSNTSTKQNIKFENIISDNKIWNKQIVKACTVIEDENIKFTILSPTTDKLKKLLKPWKKEKYKATTSSDTDYHISLDTLINGDNDKIIGIKENDCKEDSREHNGSSIAFILEIDDKKMLFLGDAHPSVISHSLECLGYSKENPLKIDFMKVSHHGSKGNTSDTLLDLIDCEKFVILTDGSHHGLPNKETLARIIYKKNGCSLFFNYPNLIKKIFKNELSDSRFQPKDVLEIKI